jgi:dolichol-phosphate mannosyltransferase
VHAFERRPETPVRSTGTCPGPVVGSLVVVMPAYNESDGLHDFLQDLDASLSPLARELTFVVVDDASQPPLESAVRFVAPALKGAVHVVRSRRNRGHGPSALAAYAHGLSHRPDLLLHVDGDGQISGDDAARLVLAAAAQGSDVVHGVRLRRVDPWFRRLLTRAVGLVLASADGSPADANSPFRAYRPEALRLLVALTPADSLVPHLHFSRSSHRAGLTTTCVEVAHRPRRGSVATGTTWRGLGARLNLPSARLIGFCLRAGWEVARHRRPATTPVVRTLSPAPTDAVVPAVAGRA